MPRSVSRFSCRDVVGLGTNAWFFQEDDHSSHLYKITLPSGDTARIVSLQSASEDGRLEVTNRELQVEYYEGQRVLSVGVLDNQVEHAELQLLVINADTGEIIFRRVVNRDQNFIINAVEHVFDKVGLSELLKNELDKAQFFANGDNFASCSHDVIKLLIKNGNPKAKAFSFDINAELCKMQRIDIY